jgi:hypothetical protein
MSRRPPSDNFTRFTSTSPHASSKPPAASTFSYQPPTSRNQAPANSPFNAASRSNETPQEKVARLRAAARAAKVKQSMSLVDRMLDRGRVWADISHRVVTYGLIGFTGKSILPPLPRSRVLPLEASLTTQPRNRNGNLSLRSRFSHHAQPTAETRLDRARDAAPHRRTGCIFARRGNTRAAASAGARTSWRRDGEKGRDGEAAEERGWRVGTAERSRRD